MHKRIQLANPDHRLPLPGQTGMILTGTMTVLVNLSDPFWAALLRDGSIIEARLAPAPANEPAKKEAR